MVAKIADLVIRERSGLKRELRLKRQALPHKGVAYPVRTREHRSRSQGNPDATVQKFGPEYDPIRMRGTWRDWWLKRGDRATLSGQPLTTAKQLVDLIRDIWLSGQELELVWRDEKYRGDIQSFTPTYDDITDVGWDLVFAVTGPGDVEAVSHFEPEFNWLDISGGIMADISLMLTALTDGLTKCEALRCMSEVIAYLDRIDNLRKQFQATIETAAEVALSPLALASRAMQTAEDLADVAHSIKRIAAAADAAVLSITDGAADLVVAYQGRTTIVQATRKQGASLTRAKLRCDRYITPKVLKVIRARATTDLRLIAREAYGTSDGWQQIATYNGIKGSVVQPGTIVLVPERRAA